jgi:hypothetical protein
MSEPSPRLAHVLTQVAGVAGAIMLALGMVGLMGTGALADLGFLFTNFVAPPNPDVASPPSFGSGVSAVLTWFLLSAGIAVVGGVPRWIGTALRDR